MQIGNKHFIDNAKALLTSISYGPTYLCVYVCVYVGREVGRQTCRPTGGKVGVDR